MLKKYFFFYTSFEVTQNPKSLFCNGGNRHSCWLIHVCIQGSTIDDFKFQAYISLNLEIGGRALIGAWVLKGTNTVLQQHCHPLAFPTFKDKDLQSLNFPPYNLPYGHVQK